MVDYARCLRLFVLAFLIILLLVSFTRTPQFLRLFYPYHYRQIIETYAAEYSVDPLLVAAVMRTESSFKQNAVSHKGALGLMQIMPETAQWIAAKIDIAPLSTKQIMNPQINIRLGTWYLAYLTAEFDARIDLVIAAYNGGPGQINRWLTEKTWSGHYANRADIPFPETRQFLYKVRTAYRKYQKLYR